MRQNLLEKKACFERWARGDFSEEDLVDHRNHDPRLRVHDHTIQDIGGLRSVSAGHKVRMVAALELQRYREYRQRDAVWSLKSILERLASL